MKVTNKQIEVSEIDFNAAADSAMENLNQMSKGCREIQRLCNRVLERFHVEKVKRKGDLQWISLFVVVIGMISTRTFEGSLHPTAVSVMWLGWIFAAAGLAIKKAFS